MKNFGMVHPEFGKRLTQALNEVMEKMRRKKGKNMKMKKGKRD